MFGKKRKNPYTIRPLSSTIYVHDVSVAKRSICKWLTILSASMIVWSRWAMIRTVTSDASSFRNVVWITVSVLWSTLRLVTQPTNASRNIPIEDVAKPTINDGSKIIEKIRILPSSRIKSLLPRNIALTRAIIWRWPTEILLPPVAILLSRVSRASSVLSCRENSPADRRASLRVASSCCSKGSRFFLRVPISDKR